MLKSVCDKCGSKYKVEEYGRSESFSDTFFPKFLCKSCADEWAKVYKKKAIDDGFTWIKEFKMWYGIVFERVC